MEKHSPTPEEREWCRQTVVRIAPQLPKHYSTAVQAKLKSQGIEVSLRYIFDCKNLLRHDSRVVRALMEIARTTG